MKVGLGTMNSQYWQTKVVHAKTKTIFLIGYETSHWQKKRLRRQIQATCRELQRFQMRDLRECCFTHHRLEFMFQLLIWLFVSSGIPYEFLKDDLELQWVEYSFKARCYASRQFWLEAVHQQRAKLQHQLNQIALESNSLRLSLAVAL